MFEICLKLTNTNFTYYSSFSVADFEQVNAGWDIREFLHKVTNESTDLVM